jgi:hypothetical protein
MSQESKKETAVEWLAEKYNYLAWMRSRDEISAALAVEWLNNFFDKAKEMEKQQIMDAYSNGAEDEYNYQMDIQGRREDMDSETYFNNTYGKQQNA